METTTMSRFFKNPRFIAGSALVAVLALTLSGCKKEEEVPPPPPTQVQPAQPKYIVKVIPKPDESEELQRIYTYLPDGVTLVKLEIQYRKDARTQIQWYRTDGTVKEVQELHPYTTKVKSTTRIAADGTTKIDETTYRLNGGLDAVTTFKADGSSQTLRYRSDGKRLLSESTTTPDGKKVSTYFHQDGKTLWANTVEEKNGDSKVETFRPDGTRDQTREVFSDRMIVTVHGADGKAKYTQTWSGYRYAYSSYRYYTLEKVEEFDADGLTAKRKLEFERYGSRNIKTATDIVNGKPAKTRYFRYDGTLEREEIVNADGTKTTVKHDASEKITEAHDPAVKVEPAYDDPLVDSPSHFN
jgi:YD repeat-containing protein